MHTPSRRVVYIMISCIITLTLLYFAQQKTQETVKNISPEIVSSTSTDTETDLSYNTQISDFLNTQNTIPDTNTLSSSSVPQTLTENFSQDFFAKYSQAQSGGAVDSQTQELLISSMIDQYSSVVQFPDHFTPKNILTTSTLDKNSIKQYGNSFMETENSGVRDAQTITKTSDETKNLIIVGNSYKALARKLSQIPVPDGLADIHLKIINNYYRLGEELESIPAAVDDPVKILFIVKSIPESQPERDQLYLAISSFMKNNAIIFDENEPGSYWLK